MYHFFIYEFPLENVIGKRLSLSNMMEKKLTNSNKEAFSESQTATRYRAMKFRSTALTVLCLGALWYILTQNGSTWIFPTLALTIIDSIKTLSMKNIKSAPDMVNKFVLNMLTSLKVIILINLLIIVLVYFMKKNKMWPEGSIQVSERVSLIITNWLFGVSTFCIFYCGWLLLSPSEEALHFGKRYLLGVGLVIFFVLTGFDFWSNIVLHIKSHPWLSAILEILSFFAALIFAKYSIQEFKEGFVCVISKD